MLSFRSQVGPCLSRFTLSARVVTAATLAMASKVALAEPMLIVMLADRGVGRGRGGVRAGLTDVLSAQYHMD